MNRNIQIAMDHAAGLTFADIGLKYQIHPSRAHQIWESTLERFGLLAYSKRNKIDATFLGLHIRSVQAQVSASYFEGKAVTPQNFYYELDIERRKDADDLWLRRRATGYSQD